MTSRRASASEVPLGRNWQEQEHRRPASARRRASQGRDAGDQAGRSLNLSDPTLSHGSDRRAASRPPGFNRAFSSLTSIRFRRGESQWVEDSSDSGDSHAGSRSLVEEVLNDVFDRDVEEGSHSSVSNGSDDDSRDFDVGRTIFRLASGSGSRRPEHWTAANGDGVEDGPASLDLMRLASGSNQDGGDGRGNKGTSHTSQRQGLFLNFSAGSSDGSNVGSSAGSSELWDHIEHCSRHSNITEVSPLTEQRRKKRRMRKLVARRCAKAALGIVALAALGGSAGYFALGKGYDPVVEFLIVNTIVGRWLGIGNESLAEIEEAPSMHRTLPARLEDMLPRHMRGERKRATRRNAMIQDNQGDYYSGGQGQDRHLTEEGGWNVAPRWDYRPKTGYPLGTEDGGAHEEMRDHVPQGRSRARQDFADGAALRHGVPLQGAGWN